MVARGIGGKDIHMTEKEKLLRDINGLRDSIRRQLRGRTMLELTRKDYVAMREGIDALSAELAGLFNRLKAT
jgi:hypothetical protein